ncbi:MAG: hypothetical protein QOI18_1391 [Solirubrobacteraceae bacterium]|nr:hypothetical protein [Solirubrobacteraceae bacterium]
MRSAGLSTLGRVSAAAQHEPFEDDDAPAEALDTLPVLAQAATVVDGYPFAAELARVRASAAIPAVQAAAVAAGGFVAGAAVAGLVTRRQRGSAALAKGRRARRRLGRGRRGRGAAPAASELVQIVGSRSLLVDVHLLGGRD